MILCKEKCNMLRDYGFGLVVRFGTQRHPVKKVVRFMKCNKLFTSRSDQELILALQSRNEMFDMNECKVFYSKNGNVYWFFGV